MTVLGSEGGCEGEGDESEISIYCTQLVARPAKEVENQIQIQDKPMRSRAVVGQGIDMVD